MRNWDKAKQNILDRSKKGKWTTLDYQNYIIKIKERIEIYAKFTKDKDRDDILVDFLLIRIIELTEILFFLKKIKKKLDNFR